jgi:V/A-type H+-transporting ATPase subunit E
MSQVVTKLGDEILEEAKAEAKKRIAKAEEEAKKIIDEAKAEAKQTIEEEKSKALEEIKLLERRILSETRRKISLKILEEKNRLISEAFKEAYKKLKNVKNDLYAKGILHLIEASALALGSEKIEVRFNRKDMERSSKLLKGLKLSNISLSIGKKPIETVGGFILTTPDERIKVDQTFETRLQFAEKFLKREVAKILFAE